MKKIDETKHYNLTVTDQNDKSITTTNMSTEHPDEISRLLKLSGVQQPEVSDCGCGGDEVTLVDMTEALSAEQRRKIEDRQSKKKGDDWWDDEPKSKVKHMKGRIGKDYDAGEEVKESGMNEMDRMRKLAGLPQKEQAQEVTEASNLIGEFNDLVKAAIEDAEEAGAYSDVRDETVAQAYDAFSKGDFAGAAEMILANFSDQDGGEVSAIDNIYQDLVDDFKYIANATNEASGEMPRAVSIHDKGVGKHRGNFDSPIDRHVGMGGDPEDFEDDDENVDRGAVRSRKMKESSNDPYEFYDGAKVRLTKHYDDPRNPNAVYTLSQWDADKQRGWIGDENGEGWYVDADQLILVDDEDDYDPDYSMGHRQTEAILSPEEFMKRAPKDGKKNKLQRDAEENDAIAGMGGDPDDKNVDRGAARLHKRGMKNEAVGEFAEAYFDLIDRVGGDAKLVNNEALAWMGGGERQEMADAHYDGTDPYEWDQYMSDDDIANTITRWFSGDDIKEFVDHFERHYDLDSEDLEEAGTCPKCGCNPCECDDLNEGDYELPKPISIGGGYTYVVTNADSDSTEFAIVKNGQQVEQGWYDRNSDEINFRGEYHDLSQYATVVDKVKELMGIKEGTSRQMAEEINRMRKIAGLKENIYDFGDDEDEEMEEPEEIEEPEEEDEDMSEPTTLNAQDEDPTDNEPEFEGSAPAEVEIEDFSKKTFSGIPKQKKERKPSKGDNPLDYSLDESAIFESLMEEFEEHMKEAKRSKKSKGKPGFVDGENATE